MKYYSEKRKESFETIETDARNDCVPL